MHIIYRLTTLRHITDRHDIHALLHSLLQRSFLYFQSKPCVNFSHHGAAICCASSITFSMLNCPFSMGAYLTEDTMSIKLQRKHDNLGVK